MDMDAEIASGYSHTRHQEASDRLSAPWLAIGIGALVVAIATAGMLHGREPFASWYYLFAWYGTLLAADGVVALTGGAGQKGRFLLLDRPAHLATVLGWSAVIWLFYEVWNFRLQNWYYVFLPNEPAVRWIGTVLSFATVLPAVFLAEAVLKGVGFARDTRWRPFSVTGSLLLKLQIAAVVMMALILAFPRYCFPLVWGATTLFVEPIVYRRAPGRSLLGDLEQGRPGRILRLLAGGAAIGLLWEMYNIGARMKWIYTVPGLEELKLFEMPVLGFFGFPPFALECFVLWQALVVAGVAVPRTAAMVPASRRRRLAAAVGAVTFSLIVLRAMEGTTVSSLGPRLSDVPEVPAAALARAGYDAFALANAQPAAVAADANAAADEARSWIEFARLATLRGIGTDNARKLNRLGIGTVEQLAAADATSIARGLERIDGRDVVEARIRVWVRAARRQSSGGP
jgi:predicted flap endonuclease-1-like 5' DNA nuclease